MKKAAMDMKIFLYMLYVLFTGISNFNASCQLGYTVINYVFIYYAKVLIVFLASIYSHQQIQYN